MIKRVVSLFLITLILTLPISFAQEISYGSNFDRTCEGNSCETKLYSYEKYWLNENNEYEEIDESWDPCGNSYCTNNYYFNVTADSEGVVTSYLGNDQLSMQLSNLLNGQLSFNPVIDGSLLTYENIIPGVDLRYQYLPRKLKEEIIIRQPLQSINNLNNNFNIAFTKSGNANFNFADSIICDSRGYCEGINHQINSDNIQLEIPIEFLTNETTVYPVIIDPTLILNNGEINWNGVVQKKSTKYSRVNNPSTMTIGELSPGLTYGRADIDWDLSELDDRASINNVTLQIYVESIGGESGTSINITKMDGNSSNYSNDNSGNQNFYNDMNDGAIYAGTPDPGQGLLNNFSFSSTGVTDLKNGLSSDSFSTGLDPALTASIAISGKDHTTSSQRPVLIVEHSYESHDLVYDANGNLIEGFGKKMAYDGWNRLVEVNNSDGTIIENYVYDHTGKRVKKTTYNIDTDGNNKSSYYIGGRPALFVHNRVTNGTIYNQTYIYLQDKLIAKVDNDKRKFFYHPDHLGSTTMITNESGDVVQYISYLPFGEVLSGDLDDERFGFTGQENDGSGFIDYGARQYDSRFRRFVQCDSIIPDIYNPQDLNCYAYVRNNPYKYKDETGEFPVTVVAGLAAGSVVGVIQGYVTYQQTGDLNKAVTSGIISGGATALTVATLGAASTTAVAGGAAARYVGVGAVNQGLFAGGVGAFESIAQQTLVQGTSLSDISYGDVAISAGANSLGGSLIGKSGLPGVISRGKGTFFPSTFGVPFGKETISKTSQSLYSEGAEFGIKKLIGDELYFVNNQFTSQLPVNEEGGGNKNRVGSGSGGSGGGFGSSTPPNQYQTPIGVCGVVMSCL